MLAGLKSRKIRPAHGFVTPEPGVVRRKGNGRLTRLTTEKAYHLLLEQR